MLNQCQVDKIIDGLRLESPDLAVAFFHCLRDEYGFQHSRFSRLVVCHVLAGKRRFRDLRLLLKKMLQEEGALCYFLLRVLIAFLFT